MVLAKRWQGIIERSGKAAPPKSTAIRQYWKKLWARFARILGRRLLRDAMSVSRGRGGCRCFRRAGSRSGGRFVRDADRGDRCVKATLKRYAAVDVGTNKSGAYSKVEGSFRSTPCTCGHLGRLSWLAEGVGFEPTRRFPAHTLSKRAPSATRPPLREALNPARKRRTIAAVPPGAIRAARPRGPFPRALDTAPS